jgi:hypothetical protein
MVRELERLLKTRFGRGLLAALVLGHSFAERELEQRRCPCRLRLDYCPERGCW